MLAKFHKLINCGCTYYIASYVNTHLAATWSPFFFNVRFKNNGVGLDFYLCAALKLTSMGKPQFKKKTSVTQHTWNRFSPSAAAWQKPDENQSPFQTTARLLGRNTEEKGLRRAPESGTAQGLSFTTGWSRIL